MALALGLMILAPALAGARALGTSQRLVVLLFEKEHNTSLKAGGISLKADGLSISSADVYSSSPNKKTWCIAPATCPAHRAGGPRP